MVGVLTLRLGDKHHRQTSGGILLTSGFGAPLLYDDLLPIAGKRAAGGAFRLDWVPWVSKMTASRAFGAPVEILGILSGQSCISVQWPPTPEGGC